MQVLFVVTTCLCEIIGEDLDGLIEELQNEVKPKLLIIHTDNFNTEDCAPGIEQTMLVLKQLMKPQEFRKKSINVLGAMEMIPRDTEILKLLTSQGVEIINIVPTSASPDEIEKAPAAELNIVFSHYGLPLAREMKKNFGTEYIYIEKALTPDCIAKYYNDIAHRLQLNIEKEVQFMKDKAVHLIKKSKNRYRSKTCALGMLYGVQIARYFDIVDFLTELGFEVKVMFISEILPSDAEDIKRLLEKGINPYVVRVGNYSVIEKALIDLKPDYFFGGYEDIKTIVRLGIETRNFAVCNNACGFETISSYLDILKSNPPGMEAVKYRELMLSEGS